MDRTFAKPAADIASRQARPPRPRGRSRTRRFSCVGLGMIRSVPARGLLQTPAGVGISEHHAIKTVMTLKAPKTLKAEPPGVQSLRRMGVPYRTRCPKL